MKVQVLYLDKLKFDAEKTLARVFSASNFNLSKYKT